MGNQGGVLSWGKKESNLHFEGTTSGSHGRLRQQEKDKREEGPLRAWVVI